MNPTGEWYQAAGLGILGWGCLALAGRAVLHQKVQEWWVWACGIVGAILCLASGTYLANTGIAKGVVGFIKGWPLVAFIVFVVVVVGVVKLPFAAMPDRFHSLAITMGVAVFVLCLPSLIQFVPGKAGVNVEGAMTSISRPIKEHTAQWFDPDYKESGSEADR